MDVDALANFSNYFPHNNVKNVLNLIKTRFLKKKAKINMRKSRKTISVPKSQIGNKSPSGKNKSSINSDSLKKLSLF